jgi:hypothetical protein
MFLYRIEIELKDQLVYFVVLSDSDEKAFGYAEDHLVRHFIVKPEVEQIVIIEKKRVQIGSGYLFETGNR